jgi:hypothetical protein
MVSQIQRPILMLKEFMCLCFHDLHPMRNFGSLFCTIRKANKTVKHLPQTPFAVKMDDTNWSEWRLLSSGIWQRSVVNFRGAWCLHLHDILNTVFFMLTQFILMRVMQMMMDVVIIRNETWKGHTILTYRMSSKNHKNVILTFIYDLFKDAY